MVEQNEIIGDIRELGLTKHVRMVRDSFNGKLVVQTESWKGIAPNDFYGRKGCMYVYTQGNKILKIGETTREFSKRLEDYNKRRNENSTDGELLRYLNESNRGVVRIYMVFTGEKFMYNGVELEYTTKMLEQIYISIYKNKHEKLPPFNKVCF